MNDINAVINKLITPHNVRNDDASVALLELIEQNRKMLQANLIDALERIEVLEKQVVSLKISADIFARWNNERIAYKAGGL
jgi:hypothetical protein